MYNVIRVSENYSYMWKMMDSKVTLIKIEGPIKIEDNYKCKNEWLLQMYDADRPNLSPECPWEKSVRNWN